MVETKPNAPSVIPGQSNDLTEEELKFMADAIGEDNGSEVDNEDLEESDGGMTEDIADAYEQFLADGANAKEDALGLSILPLIQVMSYK